MTTDGELWHFVEAKRDDGMPTMFNIRELEPKRQLTTIFVVELPYPKTDPACLPCAADFRRQARFDQEWLRPACGTLGWELVGSKVEDGSFFFYMYGAGDPGAMIEKLSPFDGSLGFYDDNDPDWQEYGTLRDLLDKAKAIPRQRAETVQAAPPPPPPPTPRARATTVMAKVNAKPKAKPNGKAKPAKAKRAKAKPAAKKTAGSAAKAKGKAKRARPAPPPAKGKAKRTSSKRAAR